MDGCRVVGNLPIQQLRNLTYDPGKPLIAKRRAKKAAEDECHRHRSGTDRKPSTALAVGRDKKNENKNPCSKENQRDPHVTRIIASHEPKMSKDLPTAPWSQASAGFRSLVSHRRHELENASDTEVRLTSTIDAALTFGHGRTQLHLSLSSGLLFLSFEFVLLTG